MKKPFWLKRAHVLTFHDDQLRVHGGLAGIRDSSALDAALERPINLLNYEQADLCALAACYAHGIAKNHPFLDGNKRVAFLAAAVFLDLNGIELTMAEHETARAVEDLASSGITQEEFADLLRQNSRPAEQG